MAFHPQSPAAARDWAESLRPALLLVLGVLAARIMYLVWFCRYDLVEDEAHYWLWSRYLDWSYYSKGPGVAWAIRVATTICGDAEWAVRLPTALAAAIGALAAGALARDLAADARARRAAAGLTHHEDSFATPQRVGLFAALAYTLAPALQGTAILMTIDGPYVACWSVACWAFWQLVRPGSPGRTADSSRAISSSSTLAVWSILGAAIALGFLFKYTILLLILGLIAFVLVRRRRGEPGRLSGAGVAIASALVAAGLAPVLYWNAANGWPTIAHLLGHLGMAGGDIPIAATPESGSKWSATWLPELIGQQIGLIGPWLFLAVLARLPAADARFAGRQFLLWMAIPILAFYAVVSLITEPEGNWPLAAYATLLPLGAWIGADALAARAAARSRGEPSPRGARLRIRLWRIGLTYTIIASLFIHKLDLAADAALALDRRDWFHDRYHRLLGRDPAAPTSKIRDWAGRLRGSREMATHVTELLGLLRDAEQREPFVVAQHYGRASQLAYYLRRGQRPWTEVVCAMHYTGGRASQFDFWPDTPQDITRSDLLGRPAVIVTSVQPYMLDLWRGMFARVEPIPGERLRGESKPDRSALLGQGFKGVPGGAPVPAPPR